MKISCQTEIEQKNNSKNKEGVINFNFQQNIYLFGRLKISY